MKKKRISIIDQILSDGVEESAKTAPDTATDADSYLNFLDNFNCFIKDDLIARQERYINLFNSLCKIFPNDYKRVLAPVEEYVNGNKYVFVSPESLYSYLAALKQLINVITRL